MSPVKIYKTMLRNGSIPEIKDLKKIDVDQAIQLVNYLNDHNNDLFSKYVWWSSNQFIHLTYRQAANLIAENNGFQIEYLKHIVVALHPERYKI